MQIAAILGLSRAMGSLFRKMELPQVVGEMAAGIVLGPTILGWQWPWAFAHLFPPGSTEYLGNLSQLGVVFFLFLIGLELDPRMLLSQGRAAVGVGIASIALPFLMGLALAAWMWNNTTYLDGVVNPRAAFLFMGTAAAVTAFPVLARILTETGLQKTRVGAVSIAAAAANDVVAWCILAAVVAYAHSNNLRQGLITTTGTLVYVAVMIFVVRPFIRRLETIYDRHGRPSPGVVAGVFFLILISAVATEMIGIHALFGAFMMGAIMPRGTRFVASLGEKIEDFTVLLLLPVFFAYAGLNTTIRFAGGGDFWFCTLLVIGVACAGKIGGAAIAARVGGFTFRESFGIGILMNTRGLMELVILNVGREMKVISDSVYAMMVIMALVTTAMTAPLIQLIHRQAQPQPKARDMKTGGFSVLIPLAMPRSAVPLAELAELLAPQGERSRVIGVYLRRPHDDTLLRSQMEERPAESYEPLQQLRDEVQRRGLPMESLSQISRDPGSDIAEIANLRAVRMILMGFHRPLLTQSILGGTVHTVLSEARCHVGVFVDRGFHGVRRIVVPYMGSWHDHLALELAGRIARNVRAQLTVLHVVDPNRAEGRKLTGSDVGSRIVQDSTQPEPVIFTTVEDPSPVDVVIREAAAFDLLVIGVAEEWGLETGMFGFRGVRIASESPTSMLIVRRWESPVNNPANS